ncbi:NADAR family protein [Stieleria varia]|uniref:Swarming motility protein YbiA n=1 Tax=Stieleria varia TaxID=2528005 RepID=A0A5C5ZXP8_9BACT|nr:NADAR family protein [Stieleria varia]TWT92424.1 Swarming motility protein YbiA [Stieleria varia]
MPHTEFVTQRWKRQDSAWFCRTSDPLGDFSNFASGMPIPIHGYVVPSSEHLYQAMRFPHLPEVQFHILDADAPKTSKTIARDHDAVTREDWMEIRIDVMRWVLARKIKANAQRMSDAFGLSADLPIVELSRRDAFWGAAPQPDDDQLLVGQNVLGCLLTEMRKEFRLDPQMRDASTPRFPKALLFSRPI